ncbi:MAG: protein translocase subunit SecD [Leptotrichiaceae bacterium]|nr:protein translocase subunit SecD [Leptotrichiaceae bacterium]MBP7100292.1 protein translocase subunit SecD [Leptotrichiaceae bacterium]MBP7739238.1 protein translocase subunit SecD [Leptotrichiaceae bacterium]MBP9629034.1 protein translocase subunit SecD [Leptotrichiaceae bacterium]
MKNRRRDYIFLAILLVIPVTVLFLNKIKLGLDLRGGTYLVLQADGKVEFDTMDKVRDIVERRIDSLGVAEPVIQLSGDDRLIVELAGIKDPQKAIDLIGTTAKLEFKIKNNDGTYGPTLLEGSAIKNANLSQGQFGQAEVDFELNAEGVETFAKITRENRGKYLAIMLDNKEQSAPIINQEILGGRGVITTGNIEDARNLTNLLKSGALPVNIKILETRTVGPTLGAESIKQTQLAGVLALIIISIFMGIIYKIPGLIANIVLLIYGLLTMGTLSLISATLTLPGIAGLILTLGMAVDANVITFERIKDELRKGYSLNDSIEYGFKNGLPAILDGNMTTLLIAIVLFFLGTGPVKGFAVTLALGTLITLITAVFVTKIIFNFIVTTFNIKSEKLFWKVEK